MKRLKKRVTGLKACSKCKGCGNILTWPRLNRPTKLLTCFKCKGTGKQKLGKLVMKQCDTCRGDGFTESYYVRYLCLTCQGKGEIKGYKVE